MSGQPQAGDVGRDCDPDCLCRDCVRERAAKRRAAAAADRGAGDVEARHREDVEYGDRQAARGVYEMPICICGEDWPCRAGDLAAMIDAARDEWRAPITDALEMAEHTTHGVMRARLDEVLDVITSHRDDAREHWECPAWCDDCERWERPRTCEHCNGSGCGPGTALGAYEECEWCAGDGREHEPDAAVRDQGGATDRTNEPTERTRP